MVESLQFKEWVQEKTVVDGLVSVYKPYGIPSTMITELYKIVTKSKVGHGGTLDPMAEGAMLLGIGNGTKLLTKYLASEKKYHAEILIGAESLSSDLELPITLAENEFEQSSEKITEIFEELALGFTQELPALSAAKQNGKAAYSLIREGKPSEKRFIETKLLEWKTLNQTELSSAQLQELLNKKIDALKAGFEKASLIGTELGYHSRKYDFMLEKWVNSLTQSIALVGEFRQKKYMVLEIEVLVPKGTYIRSLAQDIASRLGTVGMLLSLERLNAGNR